MRNFIENPLAFASRMVTFYYEATGHRVHLVHLVCVVLGRHSANPQFHQLNKLYELSTQV